MVDTVCTYIVLCGTGLNLFKYFLPAGASASVKGILLGMKVCQLTLYRLE